LKAVCRSIKVKPVLYVKYIESAPWNLRGYAGAGARFGGIGISLIRAAIAVSLEEEFRGRIALHSLPQSEPFYGRFMEDLGIDPDVEGFATSKWARSGLSNS
jgi:hypothetical protein